MTDYALQLANLETAIAAIEQGAQEYRIGSRTVRRAELATLYAQRDRLEAKVIGQETGRCTVARLIRR